MAKDRTRRQFLRALGIGAAGVLTAPIAQAQSKVAAENSRAAAPNAAGPNPQSHLAVEPFRLVDVRLLPGPFLDAQHRDEKYLLQLEPDRLLHNFRLNAGLPAKAAVYGGWESQEPWVEIRCHGHTLGHYLSACSLMHASTLDDRFRERVDYLVDQLAQCQEAGKSGLICAFPDGAAQLDNSIAGKPFLGVPWYTMHKICAGLRDAHVHVGNARALQVLRRLTDWAWSATRDLTDDQLQRMLDREHGGLNEVFADVYALTREPKYLQLAQRFSHRALLVPLAERRDVLDGLHSNTQIPKVIGFCALYDLTGERQYRTAAEFFWQAVVQRRSFATGGNGDVEHFFPPAEFSQRLDSAKTMETCCTYNLLRLTRALFMRDPKVAYADFYERALYNGILASQDPDSGMMTYFQATRPGYVKLYCKPFDSFWCCTGSGMENHAKYADSVYFQSADALYVNLFIASELNVAERGFTLTQRTEFPARQTTQLRIEENPNSRMRTLPGFALKIRHPSWCEGMDIVVNGKPHLVSRSPGEYVEIRREWRGGDVIDVSVPMKLRLEQLPGAADRVAILYGPIVLAGRFGHAGIAPGADLIVNERTSGEMLNGDLRIPNWIGRPDRPASLLAHIERAHPESLAFRATGFDDGSTVQLVPYFQIAHERYNLYWRVLAAANA